MLFANLISVNTVGCGCVPMYCYRQLNPSTMQWMLGLFTKARLTQRSLFKSIYNILKVIFSLNKHLRDMTLFSLLVIFKRRNILFCKSDPRLKLCIWSCCLWAPGVEYSPWKGKEDMSVQGQGGWELSDAKIRGHRSPASRHHQSHDFTHTSRGSHAFFSVSYFISVHTSSFCNEI